MTWVEKVERLITQQGTNPSEIGRKAGWAVNTLPTAMRRGNAISVTKALSLARALGVTADWLFDDALDWDDRPITADDLPLPREVAAIDDKLEYLKCTYKLLAIAAIRLFPDTVHTAAMDSLLRALSRWNDTVVIASAGEAIDLLQSPTRSEQGDKK